MRSHHITAADERHQQKSSGGERESERDKTRTRKKRKETATYRERERERELGIFSMMRFDSATFSFLALLLIKSYRKKI